MNAECRSNAEAIVVDLTIMDEAADYELGFCSRPTPDTEKGLPGHAFVSFSSKNATGERDFLAVGRTIPKGSEATAAWSYFTGEPIAGFLGQERYSSGMQECLLVKVNKGPYEVARSLTEGPLKALGVPDPVNTPVLQAYTLGSQDCIDFVIDVANTLKSKGLKVPFRRATDTPESYVERLKGANAPSVGANRR